MLDGKQTQWLVNLVGIPPVQALVGQDNIAGLAPPDKGDLETQYQKWEQAEKIKEKRLDAMREQLNDSKNEIQQMLDLKVKLKNGKEIKFFSDSNLWDPQNEFDAGHHMSQLDDTSLPPDEIARIQTAMLKIEKMQNLINGVIPERDWQEIWDQNQKGKSIKDIAEERLVSEATVQKVIDRMTRLQQPMTDMTASDMQALRAPIKDDTAMDDLELRKEYYDPLVREGIIPDNQVPDRYNQTVMQFKGASDNYEKRLQKYSADLDDNAEKIQICKLAGIGVKGLTGAAAGITGSINKMAETGSDLASRTKLAGQIITDIQVLAMVGVTTAQGIFEKKADGAIDQVGTVLGTMVGQYVSSEVGNAVQAAYTAGVRVGQVGIALIQKGVGEEGIKEALLKLADGFTAALSITGDDDMARIGKSLGWAFQQAVNTHSLYQALQKEPPAIDVALKLIAGAATSACKVVLTDTGIEDKTVAVQKDITGKKDKDTILGDETSEGTTFSGKADSLQKSLEEATKARAAVQKMKQKLMDPKAVKELLEAADKKSNEALQKEIDEELDHPPQFVAELRLSLADPTGDPLQKLRDEFDNIETMILDLQKQQAIIKVAEALFDSTIGIASEFVSVLKIASAGKDLIKNLMIAASRIRDITQWREQRRDALAAASVQGFPFENRLKNLGIQLSEATARALINIAQVIGGAIAASGIGAGVGEAVTKAASATSALLEMTLAYAKEADLRHAWNEYKKALANPDDRILMRKALHSNTTLAKYAMAYAALKENDAIAKEGMQVAGLTEETLRNPSSNVENVVKFLETKWEQDPVVLRRVPIADWQVDKSGALALAPLLANKNAVLTNKKLGDNQLAPLSTGAVEGALSRLTKVKLDADTVEQRVTTALAARADDATETEKAMNDLDATKDLFATADKELSDLQTLFDKTKNDFAALDSPDDKARAEQVTRLETEVSLKLRDIDSRADLVLEVAKDCAHLDQFAVKIQDYLTAATDLPAKLDVIKTVLQELSKQLGALKPKKKDGVTPHDSVMQYFNGLKQQAETDMGEIDGRKSKMALESVELPKLKKRAEDLFAALATDTGKARATKSDVQKLQDAVAQYAITLAV